MEAELEKVTRTYALLSKRMRSGEKLEPDKLELLRAACQSKLRLGQDIKQSVDRMNELQEQAGEQSGGCVLRPGDLFQLRLHFRQFLIEPVIFGHQLRSTADFQKRSSSHGGPRRLYGNAGARTNFSACNKSSPSGSDHFPARRHPAVQNGVRLHITAGIDLCILDKLRDHIALRIQLSAAHSLNEDGCQLLSLVDGHVSLISGSIFVSNNYEIPADVDTSTGDISFEGTVMVRGNVLGLRERSVLKW